jgi:DNA-binding NarL/FixJ family response regulator
MAVSKEEALKSCEKESPSVIVVKLSANDQNCFSTIAALRAKAAKGVPIIVLSPSTDRTVTDHAVRMGATYCVPTQYDLEPLKEFLLGLLSLQNEPVDCICESGFNSTDYAYENDVAAQSAIRNSKKRLRQFAVG